MDGFKVSVGIGQLPGGSGRECQVKMQRDRHWYVTLHFHWQCHSYSNSLSDGGIVGDTSSTHRSFFALIVR